jgi:hypothetical protein
MPSATGVLEVSENITFGALSVSERPFHSAKPKKAGVPTVYAYKDGAGLTTENIKIRDI